MNLVLDVDKLTKYNFGHNNDFKSRVFDFKQKNIKKMNVCFYKKFSYLMDCYAYYLVIKDCKKLNEYEILYKDGTVKHEIYSCCISFNFGERLIEDFKNNSIMTIE
jgi:hypothetical protein